MIVDQLAEALLFSDTPINKNLLDDGIFTVELDSKKEEVVAQQKVSST